jgi:hypothetical protein
LKTPSPAQPSFRRDPIATDPVGAIVGVPAEEFLREIDQVEPPKIAGINDP